MVRSKDIITAVDGIAAFYKPLSIRLFGSYAYGMPNADSDVDLLVLKNFRSSPHEQYDKIRSHILMPFPVDLLVRQPAVVQLRIKGNDFFLREIMEKGIVLYASDNARMGEQGRRRLRRHTAAFEIPKADPARYDLLSLSAVR
jgi:predicted nucleotidyltransferase